MAARSCHGWPEMRAFLSVAVSGAALGLELLQGQANRWHSNGLVSLLKWMSIASIA